MTDNKIETQPEYDALYAFDSENNVEPASAIAERIAAKHGFHDKHPIVDDIHHAIEDALELGQRRGQFIPSKAEANEPAAQYLFGLLDDIDTVGDIAKSDDKLYRAMVEKLHRKRFDVGTTDGYTVTIRAPVSAPSGSGK